MRPVVPVVATESRLRALCTRGEVPELIGDAPITVRSEPLTECNLPGGKARQTYAVTEDDHQLRRAGRPPDARACLGPAAAASRLMARTGHSVRAPRTAAVAENPGVADAPHRSGSTHLALLPECPKRPPRRLRLSMTGLSAPLAVASGPLPSRPGRPDPCWLLWTGQAPQRSLPPVEAWVAAAAAAPGLRLQRAVDHLRRH